MQRQLNTFAGGVNRDMAPDAMPANMARRLVNFRVFDVDGQGMIVVSVGGSALEFSLSPGFLPLGSCQYRGVAFILSVNPATGEGEIGTFPSPTLGGGGGYQRVYRPLQNWTGAVDFRVVPGTPRLDLRTTIFGFEVEHQIEVKPRISYDGSVNLYWTDNTRPLRTINTGFELESGTYNDRRYWNGSLLQQTTVLFETCPHPEISALVVEGGGSWKAGNLKLYFRYVKESQDKTSFLLESGPIQLSTDDPATVLGATDGDASGTVTGKAVRVDLAGLDNSFSYIEVAFALHFDDTFEVGLIGRQFPILPGTTTMQLVLLGNEDLIDITSDEIIARKELADTCKTIESFENRLWGGNWKEQVYRKRALEDLALRIVARPTTPAEMEELDDDEVFTAAHQPYQYKNPVNTYRHVGYFRGEPYPFAVKFVLTGGKETEAFPVTGGDFWLSAGTNSVGTVRFPSNANVEAGTGFSYAFLRDIGNGQKIGVMGVVFDTSGAVPNPANPDDQWIIDNVCGFYFVRGERKPQLVYQGHVANCWGPWRLQGELLLDASTFLNAGGGTDGNNIGSRTEEELGWIAEFHQGNGGRFDLPIRMENSLGSGNAYGGYVHFMDVAIVSISALVLNVPHKFGLFSTDHFFTGLLTDGLYHVVVQGDSVLSKTQMYLDNSHTPAWLWQQGAFTPHANPVPDFTGGGPGNAGLAVMRNIAPDEINSNAGFRSRFAPGTMNSLGNVPPTFFFAYFQPNIGQRREFASREIKQRRYIGLDCLGSGATSGLSANISAQDDSVRVVNVYRTDPSVVDLAALYQPRFTFYHRISPFVALQDILTVAAMPFYRGDCFVQRTHHRQMSSRSDQGDLQDAFNVKHRYGNLIGVVQECALNPAMRHKQSGTNYFPGDFPDRGEPGRFATEGAHVVESTGYNRGYHRVLGIYARVGFDTDLPFSGLRHPVRIRYTQEFLSGSIEDQWVSWDLEAKKDFDQRMGEINKLVADGPHLFSVQERGINVHYINEREMVGDALGGSLVIGAGEVLSERFRNLTDQFGTQHQWSVTKGLGGFYGYDLAGRAVWRVQRGQFQELDAMKGFKSDVYRLSEALSRYSDVLGRGVDAPVSTGGVVGWWDPKHKEVGFTFVMDPGQLPDEFRTLVFNEGRDIYTGERTHHSPFYFALEKELYSMDPAGAPWSVPPSGSADFHLHDAPGTPWTSFYGEPPYALLSAVANGRSNSAKIFDAFSLMGSQWAPKRSEQRTEHQFCSLDPWLSPDEWKRPVWRENGWHVPYLRAEAVDPQVDYGISSPMRGKWMELTVEWDSTEMVKVTSLLSLFRHSFN